MHIVAHAHMFYTLQLHTGPLCNVQQATANKDEN